MPLLFIWNTDLYIRQMMDKWHVFVIDIVPYHLYISFVTLPNFRVAFLGPEPRRPFGSLSNDKCHNHKFFNEHGKVNLYPSNTHNQIWPNVVYHQACLIS